MGSEVEPAPAVVVYILEKKKNMEKKRSAWVKPWLTQRDALGFYNSLIYKLSTEDVEE